MKLDLFGEYDSPPDQTIPPLIKWTGGKRRLAGKIRGVMPGFRRYIEPFVGGGALLFSSAVPGSIAGDIYSPLIELWKLFKDSPADIVSNYREQWTALKEELDSLRLEEISAQIRLPNYYYLVRDRFNITHDPLDLNFIMRTCVNGIVRFNRYGKFNNSFHLSRKGMTPDNFAVVVSKWSDVLQNVDFVCQDYVITLEEAKKDDFVYLDPPYACSKHRYTSNLKIARLFNSLEMLNSKGVKWALSFDGQRGDISMFQSIPREVYKRHLIIQSGNSPVSKVLNGPIEQVEESLYLNY